MERVYERAGIWVRGWALPLAFLKSVFSAAADVVLPPLCFHCSEPLDQHGGLCSDCWSELNFIRMPQCVRCGYPFEFDMESDSLCGACLKRTPSYDQARSALTYDDQSRSMVLSMKYSDRSEGLGSFSKWMTQVGQNMITESDLIVPVPLHPRRLWKRRFNQSALMAEKIGRLNKRPVDSLSLRRHKATEIQGGLSRRERHLNVRGAFHVSSKAKQKLNGKTILLIDDVMTTGATVEACSRTLKNAGATKVNILTLARVVRPAGEIM